MRLSRTFRVANHLCYPIAITQINEDQATMISSAIDPTSQRDLLSNILDIEITTCVCTIIYLKTHVKGAPFVCMYDHKKTCSVSITQSSLYSSDSQISVVNPSRTARHFLAHVNRKECILTTMGEQRQLCLLGVHYQTLHLG